MTDDSLTFIALTTYEYLLLTTTVTGIKRDHKQSKARASERECAHAGTPRRLQAYTCMVQRWVDKKVKSEDHILIGSSLYFPCRRMCKRSRSV